MKRDCWVYSVIPLTALCCTPVLADCIMHWGLTSLSMAGVVEGFTLFSSHKAHSYSVFNRIPEQLYHYSRFSAVRRPLSTDKARLVYYHSRRYFPADMISFVKERGQDNGKKGSFNCPYPALFFILPLFSFIEADTPWKKRTSHGT